MMHFITFGNDEFKNQTARLAREASATGWFDSVTVESPETTADFHEEHREFISNNKRGHGYWVWKPYIIKSLLSKVRNGDFVFYTDAGATIVPHRHERLIDYVKILERSEKPVLAFSAEYKELHFQKMSALKRFRINDVSLFKDDVFLDSNQVESGILICRKSGFAEYFIARWLELALEEGCNLIRDHKDEEDRLEGFIEHRHDQSLLSILCKIYDTHIMCCNEAYGLGPFFSSRLADKGPREFAPDMFRTDPRYDPYRHFTWKEWISDYGN